MNVRDLFTGTLHALWANKVRTLLTMFGIAWGIVSITLMVAAGEGLRAGANCAGWIPTMCSWLGKPPPTSTFCRNSGSAASPFAAPTTAA